MATMRAAAGCIGLAIAGCAYLFPSERTEYDVVRVETEPAGAAILVANDYVGDSPIDVRIKRRSSQRYSFDVRAVPKKVPAGTEMWEQALFVDGEHLPRRLFFNLRLRPRPDTTVEVR